MRTGLNGKLFWCIALHLCLGFACFAWETVPEADLVFDASTGAITGYTGSGGKIKIPDAVDGVPVTSIGDSAFAYCTSLTGIIIPNTVSSVGDSVFRGCSNLEEAYLPANITSIGKFLFYDCNRLISFTIHDSVTEIGEAAFSYCTSLTEMTIPNSITTIGDYAFCGCFSLEKVYLPANITSIGKSLFYGCGNLENIAIPASVTSIGNHAFQFCGNLLYANITTNITSIGDYAFADCGYLIDMTIPSSVTNIGNFAFANCSSLPAITVDPLNPLYSDLEGVLFNKNQSTLFVCPAGKEGDFTIPPETNIIWDSAFASCGKLTNISIPDSITRIGDFVFAECCGLTSVTIPPNVTSIGKYAFADCTGLTRLTIGNGVTVIGDYAFVNCSSLTSLAIPAGVTEIGEYAFSDCTGLTSMSIPNGVTNISIGMFCNCTGLTSVTIGNGATVIGDCAFASCSSLPSMTIPHNVTSIGNDAFADCTGLTSLTIGNGVTVIGDYAFIYCKGLTTLAIPPGVTEIGEYAFSGCYGLTSLSIPDSLTAISIGAFSGCTGLTTVTIPFSVDEIGDYAFSGCTGLTRANFPGDAPFMGKLVFYDCASNFKVYYHEGSFGFSSVWLGYNAEMYTDNTSLLHVFSYGVESVPITSKSGHGGTTHYALSVINGETVSLTAPDIPGMSFYAWAGDENSFQKTITFTIKSRTQVTANFIRLQAALTTAKVGKGTVSPASGLQDTATAIPIKAVSADGYHFVNWTKIGNVSIGDADAPETTATLTGPGRVTANFAVNIFTVTFDLAGKGSRTGGGALTQTVKQGTAATAPTVSANAGWMFTGWDKLFDNITSNCTVTAIYSANLSPPASVTASDDMYFDKIRVTWPKVAGATSYLVYRNETAASPDLLNPIAETTALYYDDFGDDIVPQVGGAVKKYYYWVAAKNRYTVSALSKFNDGYLSKKGPAKVTASVIYSEKIVVTWAAVPGATAYDVYRYEDKAFKLGKTLVNSEPVVGLEYVDTLPGAGNYYKVKAKYGSYYDSDFSATGAMGKLGSSTLVATPLNYGEVSPVTDEAKGDYLYFSTVVPMGTTRLVATLSGTTNAPENDCNLFAKFANMPTKTSYTAKGLENSVSEILTVSNPSPGTWYFLLYGVTDYSDVTLNVECYSVCDIKLTQVPLNDLAVPFTATFKGMVVDESGTTGVPNIVLQVRNPITGLTSFLTKTDAKGVFSYSAVISAEGEYTFDFLFTEMMDSAKGTASHTVWTRKGCHEENNYFDSSAYLEATPVVLGHNDVVGLQNFLNIRSGWEYGAIDETYEEMWIEKTLASTSSDVSLTGKLDSGLYMLFYGVEGAGVGNDMTTTSEFSAVPFVVHVEASKRNAVLSNLNALGIVDDAQKDAILSGNTGVVSVAAISCATEEADGNMNISLLAREQLEILAILAGWDKGSTGVSGVKYSDVTAKQVTVTLANGRRINVVSAGFVK